MTNISTTSGILPIEEVQSALPRLLEAIAGSSDAIVITDGGKPVGVLLSPQEFDSLRNAIRRHLGVIAGLADISDGLVIENEPMDEWLASWGSDSEKEAPPVPGQ